MALVKSARKQWSKPPTTIYEHNYGVGMNFYQPMIAYIDSKKAKGKIEYPHLPYCNERGLEKYHPRNLVKSYSQADLKQLSNEAELRAKHDLSSLKIHTSSSSLQKTVSAAAINKVSVEVKHIKKRKSKKHESTMPEYDYNPDLDKQAEYSLRKVQKYLRGKSAYGIEQVLLRDSNQTISDNVEKDLKSFQSSGNIQTGVIRYHDKIAHCTLMDDRMTEQLNRSVMEPLDNLRMGLKGFDKKTAMQLDNQR